MPINITGHFYTTFCKEHVNYHKSTLQCAERTIAKLLSETTTSDRPGIMLGKVQSGKTRSFVTALALAFDNGYDIAVVLTKNSVALVEQTLKRLRADLDCFLKEKELEIYKSDSCPTDFTSSELDEAKLVLVANKQKDQLARLKKLFTEQCPEIGRAHV
jgi:hypothetical protein